VTEKVVDPNPIPVIDTVEAALPAAYLVFFSPAI
jgi:hypothetical protein